MELTKREKIQLELQAIQEEIEELARLNNQRKESEAQQLVT
jgi:hypothetical protein